VAETSGLLNRRRGITPTEGSNPSVSATLAPIWRVPSQRMKQVVDRKDDDANEHLVPLSRQAVEALAAIRALTGRFKLVFPSARHAHRPMSENAIGYLYNRSGYELIHVESSLGSDCRSRLRLFSPLLGLRGAPPAWA
jgi:hypothetical protein